MTLTGYMVTFNLFFQLASELLKNYFITIALKFFVPGVNMLIHYVI